MDKDNLKESSEHDPTDGALKSQSKPVLNAILIGFLIGIIIYSVAKNNVGFLTLIPLYLIYKLVNKPKSQ